MAESTINLAAITWDSYGFLADRHQWNEAIARALAQQEGLVLTESHWQLIYFLRRFYDQHQTIPPLRAFIKAVKNQCNAELADSLTLHQLFPGSPLRSLSKLAGLPKPRHCL